MDAISQISSQKRQQVFTLLPASYEEIADSLGVTKSTARDHVRALSNNDGLSLGERTEDGRKVFYHRPTEKEHPKNDTSPDAYAATDTNQKKTRHLNEAAKSLERNLISLLKGTQPPVADGGLTAKPDNEDVVVHATDDHVGDHYTDEFGNTTYNNQIWRQRRGETFDEAFRVVDRQSAAGYDFDTFHLLLGGDIVTGEGIYDGQAHELEAELDEQVEMAAKFYMTQIRRAAERFPSVQVVCQSGNHGELRFSSASGGANADRLLYLMLDAMVRESGLENVTFIRNNSTSFTNFEMRGHRGHLRHGDNSLEHIGTSSGKKRWFNWRDNHQFDVAYRGHFHTFQYDTLTRTKEEYVFGEDGNILTNEKGEPKTNIVTDNVPVIMSGSPKPSGEFEESIAEWSQPAATIHGVSDDEPVTWFRPLNFE